MENFNDPARTLSLCSVGCDVGNGTWEPHVAAGEALDVMNDCSERSENHVSCRNPRRREFIADVGGLAFDTKLTTGSVPQLPKLIPMLERSFIWSDQVNVPGDIVAISLADVFTNSPKTVGGILHTSGLFRFNERIAISPLFAQKHVILNMSGQDALIERAWMQHEQISLFQNLYRLGFRLATTPNFSVFGGE